LHGSVFLLAVDVKTFPRVLSSPPTWIMSPLNPLGDGKGRHGRVIFPVPLKSDRRYHRG
jgi:hypothetical protein